MNTADDTTVAKIILEQMGGNRFAAMTGARNFITGPNTLTFRLPGGGGFCRDGINFVRITLDPSDTYTMVFSRIRGMKVTVVKSVSDVYNDMLRDVFTTTTGLATNL